MQRFCWNDREHFYFDYDWVMQRRTTTRSLAGVFPLFVNLADTSQAIDVALILENDFLRPGGLVTTLQETGQPWDAPYGWAPLQWTAINGLRNYGLEAFADTIAHRWVNLNVTVFEEKGEFAERYNVVEEHIEDSQFRNKAGYGWTNGVLLQLLEEQ